jgi:hypothetical protein
MINAFINTSGLCNKRMALSIAQGPGLDYGFIKGYGEPGAVKRAPSRRADEFFRVY